MPARLKPGLVALTLASAAAGIAPLLIIGIWLITGGTQ